MSRPSPLRSMVATLLIAAGVALGALIAWAVYQMLFNSGGFPLLEMLSKPDAAARTMVTPAGVVVLPVQAFVTAGYGVMALLLLVIGSVARMFLSHGVTLLQEDSCECESPPGESAER